MSNLRILNESTGQYVNADSTIGQSILKAAGIKFKMVDAKKSGEVKSKGPYFIRKKNETLDSLVKRIYANETFGFVVNDIDPSFRLTVKEVEDIISGKLTSIRVLEPGVHDYNEVRVLDKSDFMFEKVGEEDHELGYFFKSHGLRGSCASSPGGDYFVDRPGLINELYKHIKVVV